MSLIDKARESEINSYFKLEEDYQSLVDHAQALERQLAEARDELEAYKYDLNTLVDTVSDCVNKWSWGDAFRTLQEIDSHYKQLKEQG